MKGAAIQPSRRAPGPHTGREAVHQLPIVVLGSHTGAPSTSQGDGDVAGIGCATSTMSLGEAFGFVSLTRAVACLRKTCGKRDWDAEIRHTKCLTLCLAVLPPQTTKHQRRFARASRAPSDRSSGRASLESRRGRRRPRRRFSGSKTAPRRWAAAAVVTHSCLGCRRRRMLAL